MLARRHRCQVRRLDPAQTAWRTLYYLAYFAVKCERKQVGRARTTFHYALTTDSPLLCHALCRRCGVYATGKCPFFEGTGPRWLFAVPAAVFFDVGFLAMLGYRILFLDVPRIFMGGLCSRSR